jgi:hypothetical protein
MDQHDQQSSELTPELLRQFPGCSHYDDPQSEEIISTIKQLAELLYSLDMSNKSHIIDYQLDKFTQAGISGLRKAA